MPALQTEFVDAATISAAEEYRRRKVTSVLSIVFTDIVRSTELREKLGEVAYEEIREANDEVVRGTIELESAGALVKSTGDGALAVFAEPSTAVERALAIQGMMTNHPHFRLRIGIDMGQVSVVSFGGIVADVFGRQVNRAARIQALAEPDHVLTSFHVYDCAVGWLTNTNVKWHNHGRMHLKGFSDEVSIHEPFDPQRTAPQSLTSEKLQPNDTTIPTNEGRTTGCWQLRIYENQQMLHTEEFSGPVELGRQTAPDELLSSTSLPDGTRRLVVARIDEHTVSRRHLLIEPHGDELRVTNLSAAQPIGLPDGKRLQPNAVCSVPLPGLLTIGRKVLRVDHAEPEAVRDDYINRTTSVLGGTQAELLSSSSVLLIETRFGATLYGRRGPTGIHLRPIPLVLPGDPLQSYGQEIGRAAARLNRRTSQSVSILWVDDFPEYFTNVKDALEAAGCNVDMSLSTAEAVSRISAHPYYLILSDMGRGDNPVAGLELLDWLRTQGLFIPTIIYCTPRGVSRHGEDALAKGALLCTAGFVSLLDGILQVLQQQSNLGTPGGSPKD